jgi:hypothetical protein
VSADVIAAATPSEMNTPTQTNRSMASPAQTQSGIA